MKTFSAGLVVAAALLFVGAAGAKNFGPGDLRVCNKTHCVAITSGAVLPQLGSFYYGASRLSRALPPGLGVAYYELRFRNGYVTGIVATKRLDHFLSYGVNTDRFARGVWYTVPVRMSAELRRLTARLGPLRLTQAALTKSR